MWLYFVCSSSRCGYCIAIVGIWSPRTSYYASIWRSSNGAGIGPPLAPAACQDGVHSGERPA